MQDRHHNRQVERRVYQLIPIAVLATILGACGSGTEDTLANPVRVNTAAEIAQVSDANYDNNVNGLITGKTLRNWIDDWSANRPSGISGKLVIFQTGSTAMDDGKGYANREFLKHNDTDIFTYDIPDSDWLQASASATDGRSNGVSKTVYMVPDGATVDAFLALYNLDPAKDMIVIAMGQGSAKNAGDVGRGWYMFRYWGVAREHLAILNGDTGNAIDDDAYFVSAASVARGGQAGTAVSVKDIRMDNTALQASLEEMLNVANGNVPAGGAFIWDARSADEFNGVADTTVTFSDNVAFEGHVRGAVRLEYTQLLDPTDFTASGTTGSSYRYFSKDNIANQVTTAKYKAGSTVYTYSRRGYQAMVTTIAAGVILGYPTRLYDGGWLEWGQLAWVANKNGTVNLAADSPWRTDQASVSDPITYNTTSGIAALPPTNLVDEYAAGANLIIETDKAYKQDEAPAAAPSCTSPCGC